MTNFETIDLSILDNVTGGADDGTGAATANAANIFSNGAGTNRTYSAGAGAINGGNGVISGGASGNGVHATATSDFMSCIKSGSSPQACGQALGLSK